MEPWLAWNLIWTHRDMPAATLSAGIKGLNQRVDTWRTLTKNLSAHYLFEEKTVRKSVHIGKWAGSLDKSSDFLSFQEQFPFPSY